MMSAGERIIHLGPGVFRVRQVMLSLRDPDYMSDLPIAAAGAI